MIAQFTMRVREYKKDVIISIILMVLAVILEVIIPYLMAVIIDSGIMAGSMSAILITGGFLIIAALVSLVFGLFSAKYRAVATAGFAKNTRKDLYYHVSNFSFQNIERFSTPSLITRLTTDINSVQAAFGLFVQVCSRSPLIMVFSLFMAFTINARLALVFVFVLPFLGILLYIVISVAFPLFRIALKTYDNLNRVVSENLKGIRVVKSFVREDYEVEKFKKVSTKMYTTFSAAEKIVAFFNPSMQLAIYICMILIAWFGAHMIVAEDMTIGQLMSFIIYINQILFALIMISMLFITLAMSRASAERIQEVFNEEISLVNPENPITKINDATIEFENVYFSYSSKKYVLENINLKIESGQTVGILGGTGSSKTSLVQLIPRLYDVTQGNIKLGGIDVRQLDLATIRDFVTIVLQKNTLFSGTIVENLRWGNLNATQKEIEDVCKMAQAHDFIVSMPNGYETFIEQGGANLSGGQKQRLSIARALLKKPKIIIFDDSTSAVDTTTEEKILEAIKTTLPESTKIIISQRIASVKDLNTIILLDNNKILASGNHSYLIKNSEIYREIYSSQSKEDIWSEEDLAPNQ